MDDNFEPETSVKRLKMALVIQLQQYMFMVNNGHHGADITIMVGSNFKQ